MADIKISEITDKASNSELSTARLIAAIPDGSGGFDTKYIEGLSSNTDFCVGGLIDTLSVTSNDTGYGMNSYGDGTFPDYDHDKHIVIASSMNGAIVPVSANGSGGGTGPTSGGKGSKYWMLPDTNDPTRGSGTIRVQDYYSGTSSATVKFSRFTRASATGCGESSSSSSTEGSEAFCSSGGSFCFAGNHRAVVFNAEDNTYYQTDMYNPHTSQTSSYRNDNTFVGMLNNDGTEFRNGVAMNIAGYDGSFIVAGNCRAAVFSKATKTWYATDYSNPFTSTSNSYKSNNTFTAMIDSSGNSWSTGSTVAQRVVASNGNFIVAGNHRAVVFMLSENADKDNTNAIWHATDMDNPYTSTNNNYKTDNTFVAILNDDGSTFRGNDLPMSINAKNGNFIVGGNIGAAVFNKDTKQWYKTDTLNPFTSTNNSYKSNNTFLAMLSSNAQEFRISSDDSGQTIATLNVSSSDNNFAAIGNHRAGVFTLSDNTWRVTDMLNPFTSTNNSYKSNNTFTAMLNDDSLSWSTGSTVAQNISDCS